MSTTYAYKRFDPDNDILATEQTAKQGLFAGATTLISASTTVGIIIETSTTSTAYFCKLTSSNGVEGSFDVCTVAYGFSGSAASYANTSQSLAVYNQFTNFFVGRNGTESCDFQFSPTTNASTSVARGFNAITFYRERYQDQLEPGTWQIDFRTAGGQSIPAGASWSLVDGAATSSNPLVRYGLRGRWDYVFSGSRKVGSTLGTIFSSEPLGLVFHDYGTIILHCGTALPAGVAASVTGWITGVTSSIGAYNGESAASAAIAINKMVGYGTTRLKSSLYFCRLGNRENNFSQNPTYYDPSTGLISNADLKNSPRTYITTVGLYNDQDELIAVGKVETPIEKSFTKETILSAIINF